LNEISTRIPLSADVELTSFVSGSDGVVVSGNTDTFNAVDEIKNRLEKGEMFKTVTITAANMDRTSNRVQFKLKLQF
ncbi:MAG: PilN domain-containing protein, partial [Desulfobacterales bacterium]